MHKWNKSVTKKFSLKEHERKLKKLVGNLTENADKKSMTASKNDKKEIEHCNMLGRKRKVTNVKQATPGDKPEGTDEKRKIKKISRQDKTKQKKQKIPKQQKTSSSK